MLCQAQHGLYKIVAVQAKHPADPQDGVAGHRLRRLLAQQLAATVHIQGRRAFRHRMGRRAAAVKHIIRRRVQQPAACCRAGVSHIRRACCINSHTNFFFRLCPIHRRVGRAVYHPVRAIVADGRLHLRRVGNIQFRMIGGPYLPTLGRGCLCHIRTQLAAAPCY